VNVFIKMCDMFVIRGTATRLTQAIVDEVARVAYVLPFEL